MRMKSAYVARTCKALAIIAALVISSMPVSASAAAAGGDPRVKQAQGIMRKFGIPGGAVDGYSGEMTKRGLCAFRYIANDTAKAKLPVSRSALDGSTLAALRSFNTKYRSLQAMPASPMADSSTFVAVNKTCQTMFYVEDGRYKRVMATTTGKKNVKGQKATETPSGTYKLGYTEPTGWRCSTLYPDTCAEHPGLGEFATKGKTHGNMYNTRGVVGDVLVHGSTDIRTAPASSGCIRISVPDADWMYHNVGNGPRPPIIIGGMYKG